MREHFHKKINVLGIDVAVMRPEKAVNLSMDFIKRKGLEKIFFLTADSSLYCQNVPEAGEAVRDCSLVLTGDRYTEMEAQNRREEEESKGIGTFADSYLKRLFSRLGRERREIYVVMGQEEHLASFREYMGENYPSVGVEGIIFAGGSDGEFDRVVNEINAVIPDIVFFCLPVEQQIRFFKDYSNMMNTRLLVAMDSVQPMMMIRKEMESVPEFFHRLHLDELWYWLKKEEKLRHTILGFIFRNRAQTEANAGAEPEMPTEAQPEPEVPAEPAAEPEMSAETQPETDSDSSDRNRLL